MKKAIRPASAKKPTPKRAAATKKSPAKPKPRKAQGQDELAQLIERLGVIVEQLGQIATQLTEAGRQTPQERQGETLQTFAESMAEAPAPESREVEAPEHADTGEAAKHD